MAQHDFNAANGSGAGVRADLNAALEALATLSSGASAPSVTFPNQFWYDTTAGVLKRRNNANTTWDTLAAVSSAAADTIIGRANGGGAGIPIALSASQVRTILNVASGATADSAASQAEQEAASNTAKFVTPGRQFYHPGSAKAWARADNAGNLVSGYNVFSVVDTGVGNVTINWSVTFTGGAACSVSVYSNSVNPAVQGISTYTASANQFLCSQSNSITAADPDYWWIFAFGDI